jgi:hypothetical protein
MKVATYEGVVENGCVQLPPDANVPEKSVVYVIVPGAELQRVVHIRSPRLVNPEQAKDFVKEVLPEDSDAQL